MRLTDADTGQAVNISAADVVKVYVIERDLRGRSRGQALILGTGGQRWIVLESAEVVRTALAAEAGPGVTTADPHRTTRPAGEFSTRGDV